MFQVRVAPSAVEDMRRLRKYDQRQIRDAVDSQLVHEPDRETRNRKRTKPGSLAEWELRVGSLRIFYDVDQAANRVLVIAIGQKKGNRLLIRGQEHEL